MSKYAPLSAYLSQQNGEEVSMSFAGIEKIIGASLPASARTHAPWWSNSRSPGRHNEAWLQVGWIAAEVNMGSQTVAFHLKGYKEHVARQPTPPQLGRIAKSSYDPASLTEPDLAADCAVSLSMQWRRLGQIDYSENGKLSFPPAPAVAGLYRLIIRLDNRTNVYVGEAVNLKRRFGNYRLPGNTQQTSLRINALLIDTLISDGTAVVDIAYEGIKLKVGGAPLAVDLTNKAVRRMIEHAAIVMHGGIEVEMLNR